jgi:hypothetical protein
MCNSTARTGFWRPSSNRSSVRRERFFYVRLCRAKTNPSWFTASQWPSHFPFFIRKRKLIQGTPQASIWKMRCGLRRAITRR